MTIDWNWRKYHDEVKEILGEGVIFSFQKNGENTGQLVLRKADLAVPHEQIQQLSMGKVTVRPRGGSCCELTGIPTEIISFLRSL